MKLSKEQMFTLVKEVNEMRENLHKRNREYYDELMWEMTPEENRAHRAKLVKLQIEVEVIEDRIAEARNHETRETLRAWSREYKDTYGYRG